MSRILSTLLLLPTLALVPPVWAAGDGPTSADPFAESHDRLMRAADAQLKQVRDNSEKVARESQAEDEGSSRGNSPQAAARWEEGQFPAASPEAIATAQRRLLALGVDAGRIFTQEGVPQALLLVAEVESGYDPQATSPKGARGLWQLMPETALRFGLRVDAKVDERTHPVRSTRVAARYLRELYLRFGDWLLALAAYNAGEARVESAIARATTNPAPAGLQGRPNILAVLALLPEETRRYVPAVMAHL